jgi:hypothetical protein
MLWHRYCILPSESRKAIERKKTTCITYKKELGGNDYDANDENKQLDSDRVQRPVLQRLYAEG